MSDDLPISIFVSKREELLFDMAAKIEAYEKTIENDKSIVSSFKPRRVSEYRQKIEAEFNPKLKANEEAFVESLRRSHENLEKSFDADIYLDSIDEAREPSRFQGRELRESNLLRRLDFLPTAADFEAEYNRAVKSSDRQALSLYETLKTGIIAKYKNEGYEAQKIKQLIESTRDGRISPDARAQKEALSNVAFDWQMLNKGYKENGLSYLKARKQRQNAGL